VPNKRLPKLRIAGAGAIWPVAAIPEPDNDTMVVVAVEDVRLPLCFQVWVNTVTDTEPLSLPTAGGLKITFRPTLCPGESANG